METYVTMIKFSTKMNERHLLSVHPTLDAAINNANKHYKGCELANVGCPVEYEIYRFQFYGNGGELIQTIKF